MDVAETADAKIDDIHPRPQSTTPRRPDGPVECAPPSNTSLPHSAGPRLLASELCDYLETYLSEEQVRQVYEAYLFGAEAHEGQHRASGEPYIYHPITVARILAEMHMDHRTLVAAILHDVIEDTAATHEQIALRFGEDVAQLVDGVSKLTHIQERSRQEKQAENFLKMLLAMSKDIRVIIIKLADRLHNMRTLGAMPADKKHRIARETLDIYAPIANRLGMNAMRLELEDLGFETLHPWRFRILSDAVRRRRGNRKEILGHIQTGIRRVLDQERIEARILCREKHIYGIYRKMLQKDLPFGEVFDVYAVRLIVDRFDTCYRALGHMHNLYKPVPGKFKDYIAIPKANGYQSLHSILFGPHGVPMELQIRTEEMDQVSESGIAAHWVYKTGEDKGNNAHERARQWLGELLEIQKDAGNSIEFLEHVKVDLFPDEVYVFTPMGEILTLPRGATPVDFAYAVHSDVGNACIAAKIDRRMAPLSTELYSGQTVEIIITSDDAPSPAWLNFVVTGKARAAIRHRLKQLEGDEAAALGHRMINRALGKQRTCIDDLDPEAVDQVVANTGLPDLDALAAEVGLGNRSPAIVAKALLAATGGEDLDEGTDLPVIISGSEGMVVQFARCCRPIPGDPVTGFISVGKGLVIHHQACTNVESLLNDHARWIEVQWATDASNGAHAAQIRTEVSNRRGVLADIAAAMATADCNIEDLQMDDRDGNSSSLYFVITVRNRMHLAKVIRRLRRNQDVLKIVRPGLRK